MYFHGGGWVLGDKITHDRLVREITNGVRATVVFVDYINSPEAQYPTQNEQAYASLKYVVEHARDASTLPIGNCQASEVSATIRGSAFRPLCGDPLGPRQAVPD